MQRLRYEVSLELREPTTTRSGRVGTPRTEPIITVCTSLEGVAQTILEKSREGDICALSIRAI